MSQEGHTLSLYPSSAAAPFNSPQTMNTVASVVPADHHSSDDEKPGSSTKGGKSRRELPAGAVSTLKAWLLSPEHFTHPYPTPQDQIMLMHKTGIDKKQLKNWFTNARRRIWKPMLKKQLEAGKLAATGGMIPVSGVGLAVNASIAAAAGVLPAGGMSVAVPAGLGGVVVPQPELSSSSMQPQYQQQQVVPQQEMYTNFQQAQQMQQPGDPTQAQYQQQPQQQPQQYQQQPQQQVQYDQNTGQVQQQPMYDQYGNQVYDPNFQQQYQQQDDIVNQQQPPTNNPMNTANSSNSFPISNSIGSLAPLGPAGNSFGGSIGSFGKMIKTDSHAVLMELFARDQDLVRQAAGKGGVAPAAGPAVGQASGVLGNATTNATSSLMASGLSGNLRWANGTASPSGMGQKQYSVTFEGVPSLSSWPHFSSVSSLSNLGGLQGVKSITNLSAADLSSQGCLKGMGNLAQVKSVENMGRGDSFAFLEVFFDDKSGLSTSNGQRGVKREREEVDEAIGLSLDGDDGASPGQFKSPSDAEQPSLVESGAPTPAPLPEDGNDSNVDGNESDGGGGKLKRAYDDALAARGLISVRRSCEKLTDLALPAKMQRTLSQEYIRQHNQGQSMGDFFSSNNSAYSLNKRINVLGNNGSSQLLYPTQQIVSDVTGALMSDPNMANASVEVPSSTKCALCTSVNVDTQLRPCGHMFHGRCLKPSLQNALGPPKCPLCNTSMQSAILAVPSKTSDNGATATVGGPAAVASMAVDNGVLGSTGGL
eukprot:CAMPEP_0172314614 /NCGR_PEP_ID=MMETSP1058-20130122/22930_1 /TAXON_ID=83371 /ORGANISM="Detonula confervacea, Strain CCMP 353" /LENGTH=760 /DNA_ID=CAMNT_0013028521 /DNA_START=301 /DNA_END=2583 /DNA_ORIENTATION=-